MDRLKDRELKALLKWKGVPTLKMGNMVAKKVLCKKMWKRAAEARRMRRASRIDE